MTANLPSKKRWLLCALAACSLLSAQAQIQKGTRILSAPDAEAYPVGHPVYQTENGYRGDDKWVVLIAHEGTSGYTRPGGESKLQTLKFMQPAYVVRKRGEYLKLIEYNPNLKFRKWTGTVANWQEMKPLGWVHQSRVLPWQVALRDHDNRFYVKYATALRNGDVFEKPEAFFEGDSIKAFSEPSVTGTVRRRLPAGNIVYAYKLSDDRKYYLVGNQPQCQPDSADKVMLGWMPVQTVAPWGQKAFVSTGPATTGAFAVPVPNGTPAVFTLPDPVLNQYPYFTQTLFPVYDYQRRGDTTQVLTSAALTNVLDHRDNRIFNVLGQPVTYARYMDLRRRFRKLNLILLVDGSGNNSNFTAPLMTVLQQMQLAVDSLPGFEQARFGAFMYQGAGRRCLTETVMPLTSDYRTMARFFEGNIARLNQCSDYGGGSVFEGIPEATRLLDGHEDETNVVIVIGASENDMTGYEWSGVINSLTNKSARLLVYQTHSDASPAYNNYIIDAKNLITQSADNIIALRKELVVESTPATAAYDFKLTSSDHSVFMLDYPLRSRWQGAVVFPNKLESLPLMTLNNTLDTLLRQVNDDNEMLLGAMTRVFDSYAGNLDSRIDSRFEPLLGRSGADMPPAFYRHFRKRLDVFSFPGTLALADTGSVANGLLLSKDELENLVFHMSNVMAPLNEVDYRPGKAARKIRRYTRRYIRKNDLKKPMPYRAMTLADVHQVFTGVDAQSTRLPAVRLTRYGRRGGLNGAAYEQVQNDMDRYYLSLKNYPNTPGFRKVAMQDQTYYWIPVRL